MQLGSRVLERTLQEVSVSQGRERASRDGGCTHLPASSSSTRLLELPLQTECASSLGEQALPLPQPQEGNWGNCVFTRLTRVGFSWVAQPRSSSTRP